MINNSVLIFIPDSEFSSMHAFFINKHDIKIELSVNGNATS